MRRLLILTAAALGACALAASAGATAAPFRADAGARQGAACANQPSYCLPDGKFHQTYGGGRDVLPCEYTATYVWGDGSPNTVVVEHDGLVVEHTYRVGTWKLTVSMAGRPREENTTCLTNPPGTYTVEVPSGATPPTAANDPPDNQDCGTILVATRSVRVYVQRRKDEIDGGSTFSQACDEARAVARGQQIAGVHCTTAAGSERAAQYRLCTRNGNRIAIVPTRTSSGPTRCAPVSYNGRRYLVFKQRVLCSFARATALRMLRRDDPSVYEFQQPGQPRAWHCHIDSFVPPNVLEGSGGVERGSCVKSAEKRWVLYAPVPVAATSS